jgi:hypothetical protein
MALENKIVFCFLLWLVWQSDQRKLLLDFTKVGKTHFFCKEQLELASNY